MANEITDLQNAVAALTSQVASTSALLTTLTGGGVVKAADVAAAAAAISTQVSALNAATVAATPPA